MADYNEYDEGYEVYDDEPDDMVTAEDCWAVITSFFDSKGLVAQQIDSYNEFMNRTMQDIIVDNGRVVMDQNNPVADDDDNPIVKRRFDISINRVTVSKPQMAEDDGTVAELYPHEARIRNLTYSCVMNVDFQKKILVAREARPEDDGLAPFNGTEGRDNDYVWTREDEDIPGSEPRCPIGRMPVMLKSQFCRLSQLSDEELFAVDECPYDSGGYFVVQGSEKVLIAQERSAGNIVQVFKKKQSPTPVIAEIRSSLERGSRLLSTTQVKLYARGEMSRGGFGQTIRATIPYVKQDVPIGIVFRAMGIVSDEDILNHICFDRKDTQMMELLRPCIEESFLIQDRPAALDWIGRRTGQAGTADRRMRYARDLLRKEFLPHISQEQGSETKKAFFLGYMINRLLLVALGRREEDDRDHFGKKRLDLAGPLMANLFRQVWARAMKDMNRYLQRCIENNQDFNVLQAIKAQTVTSGLRYSLSTGNWGEQKKAASARAGVSQVLNRYTYASTLSHLRRTNTPIGRDGKLAKPRQLHNTHWGLVCPCETPEGQACGLVKNLSLMCYVTVGTPHSPLRDLLVMQGMEYLEEWDPTTSPDVTKIFVNGVWMGVHREPTNLHQLLKRVRGRDNLLHESVSIIRDIRDRELRIFTDAGRICRPLFAIDTEPYSANKGNLVIRRTHLDQLKADREIDTKGWDEKKLQAAGLGFRALVKEGAIEYLDAEEEEMAMIAMTPEDLDEHHQMKAGHIVEEENTDIHRRIRAKPNPTIKEFTHCEIHPAMLFGVCASIIPFPDHNQSPRNVYQSAMGKQAMGTTLTNFNVRMDTMANILYYPQKPLATTRSMEYLKFRELPAGHNIIVAIATYSGYNQEDSLIMNQSSIDRGMFRSLYYRGYSDSVKKVGAQFLEDFEKPNRIDTLRMKHGTYDKLDHDGLVAPGVRVSGNDVIIGKTAPINPDDEELGQRTKLHVKRDVSTPLRQTEHGIIDQVILTTNVDGLKFVKVRTRVTKVPQIGDKFASRHGQKGTVGITYRHEDMPFTREGIVPDLVINPHCIPSRMTVAHLIECLLSKVGALKGCEGDATPFTDVTITNISDLLRSAGYQSRGFEVMYNGQTGRKLRAQIFLGPTYYQRLRHMVDDKIHARSRGPVQILTRQPVEGRARDGGLRFGEMERDCMISHGAAAFLKERLFEVSDAYRVHICEICGLMTPIA
jgi:DNA-directed RNA polymerase II subunit RPB2